MPFYKITYSKIYRRLSIYNYGCNFRCLTCIYQVKKPNIPKKFLKIEEIKEIIMNYKNKIEKVNFLGGEPTIDPKLPDLLSFCKKDLKLETFLGHTNGSLLPLDNLDGANIGIKAFSEKLHLYITGFSRKIVFDNLINAFRKGIKIKVNMVFIPELVDMDEFEKTAKFLSILNPETPFHIQGYFPIPGRPWREPTLEELERVANLTKNFLKKVTYSLIDKEKIFEPDKKDDRFFVETIYP